MPYIWALIRGDLQLSLSLKRAISVKESAERGKKVTKELKKTPKN